MSSCHGQLDPEVLAVGLGTVSAKSARPDQPEGLIVLRTLSTIQGKGITPSSAGCSATAGCDRRKSVSGSHPAEGNALEVEAGVKDLDCRRQNTCE